MKCTLISTTTSSILRARQPFLVAGLRITTTRLRAPGAAADGVGGVDGVFVVLFCISSLIIREFLNMGVWKCKEYKNAKGGEKLEEWFASPRMIMDAID